ncbi:MAG: TRAP transporter substrate-binding protein [Paracoccaceae bacterium]
MTIRKMLAGTALGLAGTLAFSVPGQAQQALKFATVTPEGSVWYAMMTNFRDLVAQHSEGALSVELFPGGQLGAQDATLSQALRGRIEIWSGGIVALAAIKPELSPLLFPGVFQSDAQASCMLPLLEEPTREVLADVGYFAGFVPLGWNNMASVNELGSLDDVAGQNMRSLPIPVAVQFWQAMGTTPVPLDTAETASALSTGMVTLVDTAMAFWVATGHAELAPHYYLTQHNYNVGAVLVGGRTWEGLAEGPRAALAQASDEGWDWARLNAMYSGFEARLTEIAGSQGATIHELSAEDRARVQAAGQALWEPLLAELGDGARAYLDTMLAVRETCPAE